MSTTIPTTEAVSEAQNYDLKIVAGGVLVYEPEFEYSSVLGRTTQTSRRLVGFADVSDWSAIRSELARLGHDVGAIHHLEEFAAGEI